MRKDPIVEVVLVGKPDKKIVQKVWREFVESRMGSGAVREAFAAETKDSAAFEAKEVTPEEDGLHQGIAALHL